MTSFSAVQRKQIGKRFVVNMAVFTEMENDMMRLSLPSRKPVIKTKQEARAIARDLIDKHGYKFE